MGIVSPLDAAPDGTSEVPEAHVRVLGAAGQQAQEPQHQQCSVSTPLLLSPIGAASAATSTSARPHRALGMISPQARIQKAAYPFVSRKTLEPYELSAKGVAVFRTVDECVWADALDPRSPTEPKPLPSTPLASSRPQTLLAL